MSDLAFVRAVLLTVALAGCSKKAPNPTAGSAAGSAIGSAANVTSDAAPEPPAIDAAPAEGSNAFTGAAAADAATEDAASGSATTRTVPGKDLKKRHHLEPGAAPRNK